MSETTMIAERRRIEREICEAVVTDALAAGYGLSLQADGEEFEAPTFDGKAIMSTLMDVDDAYLILHQKPLPTTTLGTDSEGWVRFVFGNSGYDVISDYTTNLETLLARADSIANRYDQAGLSQPLHSEPGTSEHLASEIDDGPRPWMLEPDLPDRLATEGEADREYARNVGAMHPDRAWILSDRDVWYANPSYSGPPMPHPEAEPHVVRDRTPYGPVAMTPERIAALGRVTGLGLKVDPGVGARMSGIEAADIVAEMVLEAGDPSRRTAEADVPTIILTREAAGALALASLTHPGEDVLPKRPHQEALALVDEIASLARMFSEGVRSLAPALPEQTTTGLVVDLTDHHLVQDAGRGKAIYHAIADVFWEPHFDGVAYTSPGRGTNVRIGYDADGHGTLERLPQRDQEMDRG